jgi:DNA-binding HxlR family transcriptional regulator
VLVFESRGDKLDSILEAINNFEPDTLDDLLRLLPHMKQRTLERRVSECRAKGWIEAKSLTLTEDGRKQCDSFDDFEDSEDE